MQFLLRTQFTFAICLYNGLMIVCSQIADLIRDIVSISAFYFDQYLAKTQVDDLEVRQARRLDESPSLHRFFTSFSFPIPIAILFCPTRQVFQLVAMASLYLAIKLHSTKKISIRAIASTGNGTVTVGHIEAMELSILRRLDWHLFPPTSVSFIENFYPLIHEGDDNGGSRRGDGHGNGHCFAGSGRGLIEDSLEFSRFLAELSVCSYPSVSARPSSIAIAAILLSFEYFGVPHETRDAFRRSVAGLGMDVYADSPEVEACDGPLRRVYALAMPADTFFVGC